MSEVLPLFPLNVAIVPGLVLPLHIFEPRYRELVRELLTIADPDRREFGIVAVREGRSVEQDGIDALYSVGTATVLRQVESLDDGRFDIVTTGTRRFRLDHLATDAPLARARVTWLAEEQGSGASALIEPVARAFVAYRAVLAGQLDDDDSTGHLADELPDDPGVLSYLVTAAMVLPVHERQLLLEATDDAARLRMALASLRRETALITTLHAVPALDLSAGYASVN